MKWIETMTIQMGDMRISTSSHSLAFLMAISLVAAACGDSQLTQQVDRPAEVARTLPGDEEPGATNPDGTPAPEVQYDIPESGTADNPLTPASGITGYDFIPSVVVTIQEDAPAGQWVRFGVQVFDDGVDVTDEGWTFEMSTVPAEGSEFDGSQVRFLTPGHYQLIAQATRSGVQVSGYDHIAIEVGAVVELSVETIPANPLAGELITFDIQATDDANNKLFPEGLGLTVRLIPDVATINVNNGEFTTVLTQPGRYEVWVEVPDSDVKAIDIFFVSAGSPAFIDLTVQEHDVLLPGVALAYEVYAEDQYGNVLDTVPGLSVWAEPDGASVSATHVTFNEEGIYDLYAEVSDSPLADTEGPFIVDGNGPIITIVAPERGAVRTSSTVQVRGVVEDAVSEVTSLTYNGEPVNLNVNQFTINVDAQLGINIVNIEACDTLGNCSQSVQSFLHGTSFVQSGTDIPDTVIVKINQATLNTISDWVEDEFSESFLRSQIVALGRVWSGCAPIIDWPCASIDVKGYTMDYLRVTMTPQNGYLWFEASLRRPDVRLNIGRDFDITVHAKASWATLTGRVYVNVLNNGSLDVNLSSVNVNLTNFVVDVGWVPDWLGIESIISGWFEDDVEDAIKDNILSFAPDAIDDALSDLEIAMTLPVSGVNFYVEAIPTSLQITTGGITMRMASNIEPSQTDPDLPKIGCLRTYSSRPNFGSSPGFVLGVADEFLNQILYAVWESGLLNEFLGDNLTDSIDLSLVTAMVPGATGIDIELDPMLPPVFIPKVLWIGLGEIQAGDVLISLYATMPRGGRVLISQVSVSLWAYAFLSFGSDNTLNFGVLGTPTWYFDGVDSDLDVVDSDGVAAILEAIIPDLIPSMVDYIQDFPLPAFQGFTIGSPSVSIAGSGEDYISIAGDIARQ